MHVCKIVCQLRKEPGNDYMLRVASSSCRDFSTKLLTSSPRFRHHQSQGHQPPSPCPCRTPPPATAPRSAPSRSRRSCRWGQTPAANQNLHGPIGEPAHSPTAVPPTGARTGGTHWRRAILFSNSSIILCCKASFRKEFSMS